jgi:hypothetical protein
MIQRRPGSRWRLGMGMAVGAVVVAGAAATAGSAPVKAAPGPGADQVGSWTAPFEEGGTNTPRCAKGIDGRIACKPVGYAQAITTDGRVFYFNGIESSENVQYGAVPSCRRSRATAGRESSTCAPAPRPGSHRATRPAARSTRTSSRATAARPAIRWASPACPAVPVTASSAAWSAAP